MKAIKKRINNILKINETKVVKNIFDDRQLQQHIISKNTNEQLYDDGVNADGQELGEYSPFTIEYKTKEAASLGNDTKTDHITLKDTGAFYNSFRFHNQSDGFTLSADSKKDAVTDLQFQYKAIGLNEKSISELRPVVSEKVRESVRGFIFKR